MIATILAIAAVLAAVSIACTWLVVGHLTRMEKQMTENAQELRTEFNAAVQELSTMVTSLTDVLLNTPDVNDITQDDIDTLRGLASRVRTLAASPDVPLDVPPNPATGENPDAPTNPVSGVPPYAQGEDGGTDAGTDAGGSGSGQSTGGDSATL